MSCWRSVTVDSLLNVERDTLEKACDKLGVKLNWNRRSVESYEGYSGVDAGLKYNGEDIPVGVVLNGDNEGHLKIVGDYWNTGLNEETFINSLAQEYTRINIETQLELNMGYTIESSIKNANGEYVIEAYCS